jgi:hypothetical protein
MPVDAQRVQAAFLAVLDGDPTQQTTMLERACGGDPELRQRVEALLAAHRDPASILQRPTAAPSWVADHDPLATQTEDQIDLGFLEPAPQPGALGRIGHYEVLEVIGRGGFGIVLRALDAVLQRTVAVKVLAPDLAATSPARKRFLREARAYAAVRHENVVQVYGVDEQPLPYLVMEFIPGQTLQNLLDATGPLDVPEIVRIGRQIGAGLAAAHAGGLIHRDIKPANVLIEDGPARRVKLTDFGLARAADDASLTQSGTVAGTPLYMAPEQARGEALDHRADLFSFGSVLYVMCTGRPPFRATGTMAILKRVCDDTPRPIREIIPETPVWLCELIGRLHAKDPAQRIQSAGEVVDALERGAAPACGLAKRPALPRTRKRLRVLLTAAAAVVLTGILLFGLWRRLAPESGGARAPSGEGAVRLRMPEPGRTSWFAQDRQGRWLAVPLEDQVVLFEPHSGTPVKTLGGAPERVYAVSFSPDGKRLAAGCWADEASVVVWDVATGERVMHLPQRGRCKWIAYSPDGTRLLTVSDDTTPIVWDATAGQELHRFPPSLQPMWSQAVFTVDGRYIVTHAGSTVDVWDAKRWEKVRALTGPEPVGGHLPDERHLSLAVSADGRYLAAGCETGFKVWTIADWQEQFGPATPATWLAFAPDGGTLYAAAHEWDKRQWHAVTRWDVKTGERSGRENPTLTSRGTWAVYHLSQDGKRLYAMACDPAEPTIHVYDAQTGLELVGAAPKQGG